ncbi:MAG: ribonuclease E/G, partial [Thiobacillus sp.]|nr:ribonuclease E/G [Thiobacillus sp.]
PKQPRPPRQPKPRPEAEAAPREALVADVPHDEAAGEEKREPRSRRGRGRRGRGEGRPETAANGSTAPHAVIELAGYRAIIEIARAPRPTRAPAAASAQQALQLDTPTAAPLSGAVTASPATILADLATSKADLQQVETQSAATEAAAGGEPSRPRRRRRPAAQTEAEPVSLMQVETTEPVTPVVDTAASSAPHPTRRRSRPQAVPPVQEPLVQVETQAK